MTDLRTSFHFTDNDQEYIVFLTSEEVLKMLKLPEDERWEFLMMHEKEEVLVHWVVEDGMMDEETWDEIGKWCYVNKKQSSV